jgi:hypothetical protein
MTIQDLLEQNRHSAAFQREHKEYTTAYGAQAATAAASAAAGTPGAAPPPLGGPAAPSDKRLKRNISYLTTTQSNIKLYSFQYIWSDQIYVGVMAQDLMETHPEALSIGTDGFYRVNYSLLGLEMLTLEEWESKSLQLQD